MRDIHNNHVYAEALEAIVVSNDTEGTGSVIDLAGYEAAEFVVSVGQSGDTLSGSVYLTVKVQHGDAANLSDAVDVPVADLLGNNGTAGVIAVIDDPAEDGVVVSGGYIGSKRYARVFVDTTGTHTNGTPVGAVCVLAKKRHIGTAV